MFLKKFGDLAAGVFFLILSIALFLAASALPPSLMGRLGSDFMPKVLAIITCILSFFQIRAGFRTMRSFQPNEGAEEEKPEYLRVLATIAAFTVYVFVIEPAGFLLSSHLGRLRTIRYSNVHRTFELRSCPHGFESLFILCVQRKNTHLSMSVLPFGAVEGIRTPMVAHTDLNRARLPIPPRPHI